MSSLASPEDVSVNPQFSGNSKQQTIVKTDLAGIVSKPVTFSPRSPPSAPLPSHAAGTQMERQLQRT